MRKSQKINNYKTFPTKSFTVNANKEPNTSRKSILEDILPIPWSFWPSEGRLIFALIGFWCVAGLLILGSASWWVANREMGDGGYYIKRQVLWLLSSWSLLFFVISISLRRWIKLAPTFLILGSLLIGATLIIGSTVNGASRWLIIGPLQLQPSELIKPFIILQASNLFGYWNRIKPDQKYFWMIIFGIILLLILKQPNLSTAALIGILLWLIGLAAGIKYLTLIFTALSGMALGLGSILINEYQRIRITSFLDPWQDPQGSGYQLVQSLLAIGSGGLLGQGFGLSTQKMQYLPIQSTDFIYAVFAEEFGFIGSIMMLIFLLTFAFLGLRIAMRCKNNQSKLIAIGSTTILVGQSILNIAVASGAIPTTGLPLPMVSYGGNSLLSSLFIAGLLIRCSIESSIFIDKFNINKSINRYG